MSGAGEGTFAVPGSELSALVEARDWAAGPLGDPQEWPQSLRTAVGICLSSRFPILLWWGPELVMIYNDGYRPMLGQSKHPRALGAPGREVWGEIWDVIGPMLDQVMAGGGATWSADQLLVLDRNGFPEECYFTYSYSPITDESGGVGGVFCAVTETTERVLGERRLSTLAEMVALVGARERAEVVTAAAGILRENAADHPAVAVLDAPPEGDRLALGRLVEEQLPGVGAATRARVADLVRQVSGTGRRATVAADDEAVADGIRAWHAYPVAVSAGPARGRGAAVIVLGESVHRPWDPSLEAYVTLCATHVAAVLTDVSRLADERRRREALVELDAAKSAFFTNLSHELRTPLTLIAGPVHEALGAADDPHQRELLELVERNTHRLARMVDAMLDFGRIEAGGLAPRLQVVDVSALTTGLAETFRPALERAGLAFRHDCGEGIEAHLDPDMVDRIVLNLLANAMKYTPEGSVGLRVRLAEDADDVVEISVTDTGVGMHPDDVDRAFARFERLPAPAGARSHEGAGIGLAMVQQLTELMGGEVTVTSEVGRGSTFTVRLPAGPPVSAPGTDGSGSSSAMTPRHVDDFLREVQTWQQPSSPTGLDDPRGVVAWHTDRARVVVAEDNPELREYLGRVLGDDYDVELVPDGRAALAAVRREAPDLLLTDVMMPELDGYGLVDAIRNDPALSGIPVVLLSARAGERETSSALGAGADDYLVKPFSVLELRARVASNLERAAARSQDAAWRRAVTDGLHDALLVLDLDGTVLEVNDRFTALLGWDAADGPVARPYPWDAAPGGPAAGLGAAVDLATASPDGTSALEVALRHRDGRRVVGSVRVSTVHGGRGRPTRLLATVRDVTAEHEARRRRATAAALSAELGSADELTDVVAAAVAGLSVLFGGDATVRVVVGRSEQLFSTSGPVGRGDVDEAVHGRLLGTGASRVGRSADDGDDHGGEVDGILLAPGGDEARCRVWVSFPVPRRVTADEEIAGDLLVQAVALACDRVVAAAGFAQREQHLRRAVESHEEIGQAVGILVERHRWTPTVAFERLKRTSQDHNIKVREVALRVVESGADPGELGS
ncbi:MAG: ATP-binding protein [Ornithinibacter sp.]